MVTTTPMDIFVAAYAKNTKNKPGTIATEATELLQQLIRTMRGVYSAAVRVNPTFFAGVAEVTANAESGGPSGEGWERPQEAEAIFRIERTRGTTGGSGEPNDEVVVVPYDDRGAELGKGAVFRMGQVFFSGGNPLDPSGGELRFFFSRRPDDPATVDDRLDGQWTEQFNEFLVLDMAAMLAQKDGRDAEAAGLRAERARVGAQFVAFLEHCEVNEIRRFANARRFNTNTLVAVETLLGASGPIAMAS